MQFTFHRFTHRMIQERRAGPCGRAETHEDGTATSAGSTFNSLVSAKIHAVTPRIFLD